MKVGQGWRESGDLALRGMVPWYPGPKRGCSPWSLPLPQPALPCASVPEEDISVAREGGAATQQALHSVTCPLVCVHRWLCREQERRQQTRQAETGTAPKTQQGEQRLPGEPEEQALYVDPSAGSGDCLPNLAPCRGDGRKGHVCWPCPLTGGFREIQSAGTHRIFPAIQLALLFQPQEVPTCGNSSGTS